MRKKSDLGCGGCLVVAAVTVPLVAFFNWVWMSMWNAVVHDIFKGPALNFWQALLVSIFIGMVTGGFRSASKS